MAVNPVPRFIEAQDPDAVLSAGLIKAIIFEPN
jgi:hypothetical protein